MHLLRWDLLGTRDDDGGGEARTRDDGCHHIHKSTQGYHMLNLKPYCAKSNY